MADTLLALGMVETKGLVGSIEAADAMVKAATAGGMWGPSRPPPTPVPPLPPRWGSW